MSTSSEALHLRLTSDEESAAKIYSRYGQRLRGLVRRRLGSKIRRRIDAEDVMQSTFRSFFVRAREGQYQFQQSGEVWQLLATMAMNKTRKQLERHRAARRNIAREQDPPASRAQSPGQTPTASATLLATEQWELAIANLAAEQRAVLEYSLDGWSSRRVAAAMGKSERSIRRMLLQLQHLLRDDSSTELPTTNAPESLAPLSYDDYVLEQLIGAGGMGKVFRARIKETGECVAIKALLKSRQTDPRAVQRFVQEAQVLKKLSHPGIVGIRGLGRFPSGGHFMVQDYVEGGDLESLLAHGPLSASHALRLFEQIVTATAHAHRLGVVHCDLKPANVLVDTGEHALVTDFGFACLLHPAAKSQQSIGGTVGYLAPELLRHDARPSTRADVYSLGVLLQRMLTGSAAPPLKYSPGALHQNALERVLRRSLADDPSGRFANATELMHELKG